MVARISWEAGEQEPIGRRSDGGYSSKTAYNAMQVAISNPNEADCHGRLQRFPSVTYQHTSAVHWTFTACRSDSTRTLVSPDANEWMRCSSESERILGGSMSLSRTPKFRSVAVWLSWYSPKYRTGRFVSCWSSRHVDRVQLSLNERVGRFVLFFSEYLSVRPPAFGDASCVANRCVAWLL